MVLDAQYPLSVGRSGFLIGESIRLWAGQGFTFAMTMVAFLLAGFTVLATITKPSLFAELAQIPHKAPKERQTELTELEFMVFVHYVSFLFVCTLVVLFGTKNGPLAMLTTVTAETKGAAVVLNPVRRMLFVTFGTWFVLLILKLKSFIWNVYQVVIIVIVTDRGAESKA